MKPRKFKLTSWEPKEAAIQKAVVALLGTEIYEWEIDPITLERKRVATGLVVNEAHKAVWWRSNVLARKIGRQFVRAGVVGQGDWSGVVDGIFHSLEFKKRLGKQSHAQRRYERMLTAAGAKYWLINSMPQGWSIVKKIYSLTK